MAIVSCETTERIWEIPKIRGPNIDPQIVGLLLQGLPKRALQFLETAISDYESLASYTAPLSHRCLRAWFFLSVLYCVGSLTNWLGILLWNLRETSDTLVLSQLVTVVTWEPLVECLDLPAQAASCNSGLLSMNYGLLQGIVAYISGYYGLRSMNYGLLRGIVAYCFGLPGFPGQVGCHCSFNQLLRHVNSRRSL